MDQFDNLVLLYFFFNNTDNRRPNRYIMQLSIDFVLDLMAWEDEPVLSLRPAMASLASSRYDFFGAAADMIPVQYFQDEKKSDSEFALEREVA